MNLVASKMRQRVSFCCLTTGIGLLGGGIGFSIVAPQCADSPFPGTRFVLGGLLVVCLGWKNHELRFTSNAKSNHGLGLGSTASGLGEN